MTDCQKLVKCWILMKFDQFIAELVVLIADNF